MDKIYIKQYNVRLNKEKFALSESITHSLKELLKNIPENIFQTISGFIPHIVDDKQVKFYSGKMYGRVSRKLETIETTRGNIYYLSIKAGNYEDLTKKGGTLISVGNGKSFSSLDLENNEKLLYEFYIGFTIGDIIDEDSNSIIPIRFYFIKRGRLSIDSQIKTFLEKCFHESDIDEIFYPKKESLKNFQNKISEIQLKGVRKNRGKSFGCKTVTYEEKMKIEIEKPLMETIQGLFQSNKDNIHSIITIKSAKAVIEDEDNIPHSILLDIENEDFQRDLMIELEGNIIGILNTISKEEFQKIIKKHKEGKISFNNQSNLDF